MTKEQIQERRNKGMTYKQIASEFGVSRQRVHQIFKDYVSIKPYVVERVRKFYDNRCVVCGSRKKLCVHHFDGNRRNNQLTNLTLLCLKHHATQHAEERRRKGIIVELNVSCAYCSKEFRTISKTRKFCSRRCAAQFNGLKIRDRVKTKCAYCGKETEFRNWKFKHEGAKYCSRKCRDLGHIKYHDRQHKKWAEYQRAWAKKNPEKMKEKAHRYYLERRKKLSTPPPLCKRTNKGNIITWIKNKLKKTQ